jgi:hypothetical protein
VRALIERVAGFVPELSVAPGENASLTSRG